MLKIINLFHVGYLVLFFISPFIIRPFIIKPDYRPVFGQDKNIAINGVILDKTTKQPVSYAQISVTGQKAYYTANSNGLFTIILKPEFRNGKIKVSSLGYLTQEFAVVDLLKQITVTKTINLLLVPDYKNLQVVDVRAKAKNGELKKQDFI